MDPNNLNANLIASPCPVCKRRYCPSNPAGMNLRSPSKQAVTSQAQQSEFRRKLPPRQCRKSRLSLNVGRQPGGPKSSPFELPARVTTSPSKGLRIQKCIVDFVRFSHDVTLFGVALPFGGTLRIKNRRQNTLRTAASSTGDFLLDDPLEVMAGEDYRLYLNSPETTTMQLHRGLWEASSGYVTAEWGNTTIPEGLHLYISR